MKLANKIFFSFTLTTLIAVGVLVSFWQIGLHDAFYRFVYQAEAKAVEQIEARLHRYYKQHRTWQALTSDREAWRLIHQPNNLGDGRTPRDRASTERDKPSRSGKGSASPRQNNTDSLRRLSLYDVDKQVVIGREKFNANPIVRDIVFEGNLIAYIGLVPEKHLEQGPDQEFLKQQLILGVGTSAATVLLALLVAFWMSRYFAKQIKLLRESTQAIKNGQLDLRIPLKGRDELRELSEDINALAVTLAQNQRQRKEWTSNIAHDLRTPVTILKSHCEAILDGVFKADEGRIRALLAEVNRMQRLVEDFYQLSVVESESALFKNKRVDAVSILNRTIMKFQAQASQSGLEIRASIEKNADAYVMGDPDRLGQVFDNLMQNCIRYTDSPGIISVTLSTETAKPTVNVQQGGHLCITFEDSPPCVRADEQSKLFERLYRVEKSRSQEFGGSGLGLALCRGILDAHHGEINCCGSRHGGLGVIITLPLEDR